MSKQKRIKMKHKRKSLGQVAFETYCKSTKIDSKWIDFKDKSERNIWELIASAVHTQILKDKDWFVRVIGRKLGVKFQRHCSAHGFAILKRIEELREIENEQRNAIRRHNLEVARFFDSRKGKK